MTAVAPREPIPVTILGGYLGSGKTTLLNKLISESPSLRWAVLVNDFGAINIDADLITSQSAGVLELSNGCICCSLSDGMSEAMSRIQEIQPQPEHILIEVSGVGNPAEVAVWGTLPGFQLGQILVCADALSVRVKSSDRWVGDVVHQQLASADAIVLTKTDLIDSDTERKLRSWLEAEAPTTPILDRAGASELLLAGKGTEPRAVEHHPHLEQAHRTWSYSTPEPINAQALRHFFESLPTSVVRAKAVVRSFGQPERRLVAQLVDTRLEMSDDGPWDSEAQESSVVVISAGPLSEEHNIETALLALGPGTVIRP